MRSFINHAHRITLSFIDVINSDTQFRLLINLLGLSLLIHDCTNLRNVHPNQRVISALVDWEANALIRLFLLIVLLQPIIVFLIALRLYLIV